MGWNHQKILGTAIILTVLFVLAFANLAHACELSQRVKVGAPHMSYAAALSALWQCGKLVGKPLNLAQIARGH